MIIKNFKNIFFIVMFMVFLKNLNNNIVLANELNINPAINISVGGATPTASSVQLIILLTVLILSPFLIIMLTSFTRIIISLSFLRNALGTNTMPPNQILIGIALFLTLFIMGPTLDKINQNAIKPFSNGQINQEQFFEQAMSPIRDFMFSQIKEEDLELFTNLAGIESYNSLNEVSNSVLIPSFILGELTKGFKIGFILYIPFIVIDMVVSSVLMAMGMMMLPPASISAPFKILLFVMVDGWSLIMENIIKTFN